MTTKRVTSHYQHYHNKRCRSFILDYNLVASRNDLRIITVITERSETRNRSYNNLPYEERTTYAREITTKAYCTRALLHVRLKTEQATAALYGLTSLYGKIWNRGMDLTQTTSWGIASTIIMKLFRSFSFWRLFFPLSAKSRIHADVSPVRGRPVISPSHFLLLLSYF